MNWKRCHWWSVVPLFYLTKTWTFIQRRQCVCCRPQACVLCVSYQDILTTQHILQARRLLRKLYGFLLEWRVLKWEWNSCNIKDLLMLSMVFWIELHWRHEKWKVNIKVWQPKVLLKWHWRISQLNKNEWDPWSFFANKASRAFTEQMCVITKLCIQAEH